MNKYFFIFFLTIFLSSCTNSNEEDAFSINDSNTDDVSYLSTVRQIVNTKCVSCHSSGTTNGIILEDYDNLVFHIQNVFFQINSDLMPPSSSIDLTECEINQMESWYENEMPL